jgi:hypothetical protein
MIFTDYHFQAVIDRSAAAMAGWAAEVNNVLLGLRLTSFLKGVTRRCSMKSSIGSSNRVPSA